MRPASSFRPQTRDTARVKFTRVKFKRQLEPPMQIAAATGISGGDCVVLQATAANDSESNVRATVWDKFVPCGSTVEACVVQVSGCPDKAESLWFLAATRARWVVGVRPRRHCCPDPKLAT